MADRSSRKHEPGDRLLEALVELARSAIRNDAEAAARRANMRIVEPTTRRSAA